MADEKESIATQVEALKNFPFPNFTRLKEAIAANAAELVVDRGVALKWAQDGIYAPRSARLSTTMFTWLPIIAALGFIGWTIFSKSWIMFLALPLLLIGYAVFHPGIGSLLGPVRTGLIGLTFIGQFYSLLSGRPSLLALCTALVLIWYGIKKAYSESFRHLIRAAAGHEDLLCALWQDEALSVQMSNGDKYWISFKIVNRQVINYG